MNICIFCSAFDVADNYTEAAREFATLLAREGNTLVWGGSDNGTMKTVADAAQGAGGRIIGVSFELLKHKVRPHADEMFILPSLGERKAKMLELADALVVLPGGLGTLDEITEVLELKKHNLHDKAVVFLNTDGFYDGFKQQLYRMEREGFLPRTLESLLYFASAPEDAMVHLRKFAQTGTV